MSERALLWDAERPLTPLERISEREFWQHALARFVLGLPVAIEVVIEPGPRIGRAIANARRAVKGMRRDTT
jgi:hypothetical protein